MWDMTAFEKLASDPIAPLIHGFPFYSFNYSWSIVV